MPLDAIVLTALRRELEKPLTGAKIDRIAMPEKDVVILSVHSREEGSRKLLLSVRPGSARIHFTDLTFENPPQPPMFCMLLRKHLLGGRIAALEQPAGERLLLIRIDAVDELNVHAEKTLALELMGKGLNLVLIGEDGRILDCLRRVDYEDSNRRALLPGLFYQLPPPQSKPSVFRTAPEEILRLAAQADRSLPPDRWLLDAFGGLSPVLCRELALHGWEGLEDGIRTLLRRLEEGDFAPVMISEGGSPRDYSFMPLRQYGPEAEQTVCASFSKLLDDFYSLRDRQENMRRRSGELTRTARTARDRLRRKIAAREQELLATEKREEYRRRGDLITANMYRLKKGMRSFEAQDFYADGCPAVTVPLDERKTPSQNAAMNYKLYTKAKTANRMLTELLASAREEEAYLESVLDELSRAENDRDLADIRRELTEGGYLKNRSDGKRQKLPPPRKPMRFVSDAGREILVGRGNAQNDELTFRIARRTDLWLHVQKVPGSHVIVSQAEGEADEETVRQAAALAVTFSQAREGGRAAVDCTQVRHVKKPAGARPGRVIYTDCFTLAAQADPALAERLRRDR
ncbi:MAG: NFACT family protein [Oscillospiraceae bacterium]|nr:NFACT family protein [Oscillospiraceae bacterium]